MTNVTPAILIFDVGKTNKKLLVFDERYNVLTEESIQLPETSDEDGFPCEDVSLLTNWVTSSLHRTLLRKDIAIKAVNFSGYGASFVCVSEKLEPVMPLCNYLKPFPTDILTKFYEGNGGVEVFARTCASPSLGNLNSGLQLFRIKKEKPEAYKKIKWALHLPQYLSSVVTGKVFSEMTSIGCHTGLWDFVSNAYHPWVVEEEIDKILPPIRQTGQVVATNINSREIPVGIGLHDSSSALIPYLESFRDPFILLSTGTWNISINPFNTSPLTAAELNQDCLCYLSFTGDPVKASRLFAGHEHDEQVNALAEKYNIRADYFQQLKTGGRSDFDFHELPAIAYLDFMKTLVERQEKALRLVAGDGKANQIFVDGGFSKNEIFMTLLAQRFSELDVYAASVSQASALGAALAIHSSWNSNPLPVSLIDLKRIRG